MAKEGNLLIVDDNSSILGALRLLLERHFAKVTTLTSPKLLDTVLRGEAVDAVLLDMNFTAGVNNGNEGIYWLRRIRDIRPDVKVVLFTAYADVDLAVRSMRDGAVDFVVKPWDNERLVASLRNACELARSQREVKRLREIRCELTVDEPMFWGTSPAMERIREIVEKVAATDANILITGENGTGKEMLAREIHRRSHRSGGPMVAVDMGAVPETLFESELFGHVKGAFTDARTDRAGKFEVADGGTLFLDEIGNLPLHLQPKLLTALQSGAIVRVGSNLPVKVDCRLISATNRDLFVPRRPALPYQYHSHRSAAPAPTSRGYSVAGADVSRALCRQVPETDPRFRCGGAARVGRSCVGGQYPRVAAYRREGGYPVRRNGNIAGDAAVAPRRAGAVARGVHHLRRDGACDDRTGDGTPRRQSFGRSAAVGGHAADAL